MSRKVRSKTKGNTNVEPFMARQGDVLFRQIESLPNGEMKKRESGTVAYGEVTGHSHTAMSLETATVLEIGKGVFVRVSERGVAIEGDIARVLPDVERIANDPGEPPRRRESARQFLDLAPYAGAIFLHGTEEERAARPVPARDEDRHLPIALLPGDHGTTIQREYSPEEIRNVID